jgi:hypothetical protein
MVLKSQYLDFDQHTTLGKLVNAETSAQINEAATS